jgi:hypothetical protein
LTNAPQATDFASVVVQPDELWTQAWTQRQDKPPADRLKAQTDGEEIGNTMEPILAERRGLEVDIS